MTNPKCTAAAHRALEGFTVVVFCINQTNLQALMKETANEVRRLSDVVWDYSKPLRVSVHPKLRRINVGDAWIRFEISSSYGARGLVADFVFVDELAEYQNWYRDYCESERERKANG